MANNFDNRPLTTDFSASSLNVTSSELQASVDQQLSGHSSSGSDAVEFVPLTSNPAFTNPARSKKIYKIDINQIDSEGFVKKDLVADLLNISDPEGIGGNGTNNGVFTFPFTTIEDVLAVDNQTLLVANDNNYPFSVGRTPGQPDNDEFIEIKLSQPLNIAIKP